jgi:polyisoprenoid-binding protein YceI
MRTTIKAVGVGMLAVAMTAAGSAAVSRMTVQTDSRMWVDGNSTVRRFTCEAGRIRGGLTLDPAASSTAIAELARAVKGVELTVPVADLACGDKTMDGHMRRALLATEAPEIRYRLGSHQLTPGANGTGTVQLTGHLSIAGTEKPITMTAELKSEANGTIRVKGSREIRMTEWGVKPPTLMMGTMKVHDPVTVRFDLVLKP